MRDREKKRNKLEEKALAVSIITKTKDCTAEKANHVDDIRTQALYRLNLIHCFVSRLR